MGLLTVRGSGDGRVVIVADRSSSRVAVGLRQQASTKSVIAAGQRGAPGASAGAYQHNQPSATDTWIINHNLGYRPVVGLFTVGGVLMLANVQHIDTNQARAFFDGPVAGYAVCS